MKQTKTGDLVRVSECKENEVTYGVISIKLKLAYNHLYKAENTPRELMQQLQSTFSILHTTGISVAHEAQLRKTTFIDYWQDATQKDWKVKGWTDGKTIAVLYIKNIGCISVLNGDRFLNGAYFKSR